MIHSQIFYLFFIVTIGYILGNIRIKGFSLDISAILIVALVAGHFGVVLPSSFKFFGLAIFIYAVGLQSGPGFFDVIKQEGLKLNLIAVTLLFLVFLFVVGAELIFNIPKDVTDGIFTSATTSAPALAAALEINNSPVISVIFGVTYPFAIVATMLTIRFLPTIFRIDLKEELQRYREQQKRLHPNIITKNFRITNEAFKNNPASKSSVEEMTNAVIERIEHIDEKQDPNDTLLRYGDIVRASGTEEELNKLKLILGEEAEESFQFHDDMRVFRLLVTSKEVIGKKIAELKELRSMGAVITRIRRSGIDIHPYSTLTLRLGDKLYVVAPERYAERLKQLIGDDLLKYPAADFLPISLGIVLGIILGSIPFGLPGIGFIKLSFVGGILITALILGRIGRTGNIVWQLSPHSNSLMKTLGQLVFLATIGTESGKFLLHSIQTHGFLSIYIAISAIVIPVVIITFLCRYFMGMNFLDIMGLLSGAMTSTPSLSVVNSVTESEYPSISYAAVYPLALVLTIILAQLILKI